MPRSSSPFDVVIAGTGYMLAGMTTPDEWDKLLDDTAPAETKSNVNYPAVRQRSGNAGYQDWPFEKEAPWIIDTFAGGYGHRMWNLGDTSYWYGFVDARIPGKTTLPPQRNSTTVADAETRLFDEFRRTIGGTDYQFGCWGRRIKFWTDPTSLTDSLDLTAGFVPQSATNFQGAWDTLLTFVAIEHTSGMPQPYQHFTGASVTTAWAEDTQRTNLTPLAGIFSDDSVFTEDQADPIALTLNSLVAADDFVYIRDRQPYSGVVVTIGNANGNASVLTATYWNGSAYTNLTETDGTISSGASFGQTGNVTWTMPTDWQPNVVNGTVGYHIRFAFSANFDSSVTTTDIDLIQRDTAAFFVVHKAILYRAAKEASGFLLWSSANGGIDADWTNVGTISDLDTAVTGMFSVGDDLIITTTGLPRILATGATTLSDGVWPHPRESRDVLNGIGASVWRSSLWVPASQDLYRMFTTAQGVVRIDDTVGPGRLLDNDSPVVGRVTAFAGDDYYGNAILEDAAGVAYFLSWVPETGRWHSLLNLGTGRCLKMWVSDVGHTDANRLLYFNLGTNLQWIVLPRNSPDQTSDSNSRYDNSTTDVGRLYPGRFRSPHSFDTKTWLRGQIEAEYLAAGQTIQYEYRAAVDDYTGLATLSSGFVTTTNFPTNVSSIWIEPRLTLATNDNSATPILRSFWLSYAVHLPRKPEFSFLLSLKDKQVTHAGNRHETAEQLVNSLDTALDATGTVTIFEPPLNASTECLAQPHMSRRIKRRSIKGIGPEYLYLAVFTQHQATVFGTWGRLSAHTWDSQSSTTWANVVTV
jgi:hypothetical protein